MIYTDFMSVLCVLWDIFQFLFHFLFIFILVFIHWHLYKVKFIKYIQRQTMPIWIKRKFGNYLLKAFIHNAL